MTCVYVKRKNPFYFSSENQRGYLTDFPFVLLIVLLKPKKPKIFFSFSFVLFSAVCAQRHHEPSALIPSFPFIYHLVTSETQCTCRGAQTQSLRTVIHPGFLSYQIDHFFLSGWTENQAGLCSSRTGPRLLCIRGREERREWGIPRPCALRVLEQDTESQTSYWPANKYSWILMALLWICPLAI